MLTPAAEQRTSRNTRKPRKKRKTNGRKKRTFRKRRLAVLCGSFHGMEGLHAALKDPTVSQVADVALCLIDRKNNVGRRLYRHFPDPDEEQDRTLIAARKFGVAEECIVDEPYSNERMLELIKEHKIDAILVCTFGGILSQEVIDAVHGRFFVAHPSFRVPEGAEHLPEESRGCQVMDAIVAGDQEVVPEVQVVLLKGVRKVDAGRIVGESAVACAPVFTPRELGEEEDRVRWRNIVGQILMATMVAAVVRNHLVPQLVTPKQCREAGIGVRKIIKMGFTRRQLREAGIHIK